MAKSSAHWVAGLLVTALIAVTGLILASQDSHAATPVTTQTPTTTTAPTRPAATTVTTEPSTATLEAIDTDADFSVAALDVDTGETLSYGDASFDTASIVKVDILVALLHQAQEGGRTLTASERALATAMIERSDNTAATALFNTIGGKAGLEAFNAVIGLDETVVGSNGYWGLTQTTAVDQLTLLKVVFGTGSVLTADSQAYEQGLMSNVVEAQNFGVSAAADDADDAALKVGYLQRSATGLWDVTSIGEIEAGGHTYLVAVLSDGNGSYDEGVALVDQVDRAAVDALS
ncbi:serine hydrolase [Aeromicrobium ginsengisoli]|uniref:serine hydrolase n=1 Tax=Aeromicrobium ginsengisoli TaxID=363867 RepID=UPI001CB748E3|nr:serine hydrolase [Aeromicrobium ginsengisoli]